MSIERNDKELAKLCLDEKLYVNGWEMKNCYRYILEDWKNIGIYVIFENNKPIASAVVDFVDNIMSCYVKPNYRKKGYGKMAIQGLLAKYDLDVTKVYGTDGIKNSDKFYKSIGIAFFHNDSVNNLSTLDFELLKKGKTVQEIRYEKIKNQLKEQQLMKKEKNKFKIKI
jgi:GNAT superfamily N-acetyltransferase